MKKEVVLLIMSVFVVILVCGFVIAQSSNPWSSDENGLEKDEFTPEEGVYVKSVSLCEPATDIDLYIVEDNDAWEGGEVLEDVRGDKQEITLLSSKIPVTLVWEIPEAGEYDIVVDCNKNEAYDLYIDKVDDFSITGFQVTSPSGAGKISLGENNPADTVWQYDPEYPNFINEMMQFKLEAVGEDISLEKMSLLFSGTGNLSQVANIEIYLDKNNNGKKDIGDVKIGESEFTNVLTTPELNYELTENTTENFLIIFIMEPEAEGEFSLILQSLEGTGKDSKETIKFEGTPLISIKKNILSQKTCVGQISLKFPASVEPDSDVTAIINNLTGCSGMTVKVKPVSCDETPETVLCSCVVGVTGCSCNIKSGQENKTYWACIDKDKNAETEGFGESTQQELIVVAQERKIKQTTQKDLITGNVIDLQDEESEEEPEEINLFFIAVEVTLVLILFVLFLILMSLQKREKPSSENSKK